MKKSKLPKEKKLSYYSKRAWKAFSEYIRRRDSNANGYAKCCTCELVDEWKYLQAGHFVPGRNNSIIFDERNCHAQCVGCNYFGKNSRSSGNYFEFMKKNYGLEVIDELNIQSNREVIYKKYDYQEIEEKYKQKIEGLINERLES